MIIPDEAKCRKDILHNFEISRDLPDALIEVCIACGEKNVYYKKNGELDERKYNNAHFRDLLQPYGRTGELFYQIYGTQGIETAVKARKGFISKAKRDDERAELEEKRIAMRKRVFKEKSIKEIKQELERFKHKTTGIQNDK